MIANKKVLGLIPARGGSKGIPDKNIISLCGKPLIAYTVEAAKKCKYIDDVILTTDSPRIAGIAEKFGAEIPFLRPPELAADHSKTVDAVVHAIEVLRGQGRNYDVLVLLQPTQPLRTEADITNALEKFVQIGFNDLVSVSSVSDHPILTRSINSDGMLEPLLQQSSTIRRQSMPNYYRVNGCIYINRIEEINLNTSFNDNIYPFIMEPSHSIDIDDYCDLAAAEFYLEGQESAQKRFSVQK